MINRVTKLGRALYTKYEAGELSQPHDKHHLPLFLNSAKQPPASQPLPKKFSTPEKADFAPATKKLSTPEKVASVAKKPLKASQPNAVTLDDLLERNYFS